MQEITGQITSRISREARKNREVILSIYKSGIVQDLNILKNLHRFYFMGSGVSFGEPIQRAIWNDSD